MCKLVKLAPKSIYFPAKITKSSAVWYQELTANRLIVRQKFSKGVWRETTSRSQVLDTVLPMGVNDSLWGGGSTVVRVRACEPRLPGFDPPIICWPLFFLWYYCQVAKDYPNCCHTVLRWDLQCYMHLKL